MRYVLTAAAVTVAAGFVALTPVRAEPNHYLGAHIQEGNMCWVSTSSNDQGYWRECPKPMKVSKKKK
jgi:hypothetical protein